MDETARDEHKKDTGEGKTFRLFQRVLDQARLIIFWLDDAGRLIYVNECCREFFGLDPACLGAVSFADLFPLDQGEGIRPRFDLLRENGCLAYPVQLKDASGETRSLWFSSQLLDLEGFTCEFGMLLGATDEQAVPAVDLGLFLELFERSHVAIYLLEPGTARILKTNQKAGELAACSSRELMGREFNALFPHCEDALSWRALLAAMHKDGSVTLECAHEGLDGSASQMEVCLRPAFYGGHERVLASVRDVSQRVRLQRRVAQHEKLDALSTLAGGIAHDFNNILGIIIGNAELAKYRLRPEHPVSVHLSEIFKVSFRAKRLVRQILDFSQKTRRNFVSCSLSQLMEKAAERLERDLDAGVELVRRVQCLDDAVMAEPEQIFEMIVNLGINGLKAMEPGGGVLELSLEDIIVPESGLVRLPNLSTGKYARLCVRDTGCGVHPAIAHRVFDPYFTTRPLGKGAGMGLTVALGVARNHNGELVLEHQEGWSAVFTAYLPLAAPRQAQDAGRLKRVGRGESILLVDDEESFLVMCRMMLERLGYQVTAVSCPQKALEFFVASPGRFELVITDMVMPVMMGDRLAREITQLSASTPIILCTGYNFDISREEVVQRGFSECMLKPFDMEDMAQKVRLVLDRSGPEGLN